MAKSALPAEDSLQMKNESERYLRFIDLHAGPIYPFNYKVAESMTFIFATIYFGPAMPFFYVVGLWSLALHYFMERYKLAYFYRIPPQYTSALTILHIQIMALVPIWSLMLTFWIYTNQQMFDNKIDTLKFQSGIVKSHHFIGDLVWSEL